MFFILIQGVLQIWHTSLHSFYLSNFYLSYFGNSILYYHVFYLLDFISSLSLHSFYLWTIYFWKIHMRATSGIAFIDFHVVSTSILTVWHMYVCGSKEIHKNESWPKRIYFTHSKRYVSKRSRKYQSPDFIPRYKELILCIFLFYKGQKWPSKISKNKHPWGVPKRLYFMRFSIWYAGQTLYKNIRRNDSSIIQIW